MPTTFPLQRNGTALLQKNKNHFSYYKLPLVSYRGFHILAITTKLLELHKAWHFHILAITTNLLELSTKHGRVAERASQASVFHMNYLYLILSGLSQPCLAIKGTELSTNHDCDAKRASQGFTYELPFMLFYRHFHNHAIPTEVENK